MKSLDKLFKYYGMFKSHRPQSHREAGKTCGLFPSWNIFIKPKKGGETNKYTYAYVCAYISALGDLNASC